MTLFGFTFGVTSVRVRDSSDLMSVSALKFPIPMSSSRHASVSSFGSAIGTSILLEIFIFFIAPFAAKISS